MLSTASKSFRGISSNQEMTESSSVFYWSIVQAGRALGAEDAWWHLCTLRANVARALPAGWSGLFKLVVQAFFKPPFDASQGVVRQVRGEPMLMKGKIGLVIGDEAALQGCWSFKGPAAKSMFSLPERYLAQAGHSCP